MVLCPRSQNLKRSRLRTARKTQWVINLLSDHLTKNDFSIRAGLAWVVDSIDADVNNLAHPRSGFDVRVLVNEEENIGQVDASAKLVYSRPM